MDNIEIEDFISVKNTGNIFIVRLDSSRYTRGGGEFIVELSESGKMYEQKIYMGKNGIQKAKFSKN